MVNHCSNPQCAKPLHYLRDGRIFVFDVPVQSVGGEANVPVVSNTTGCAVHVCRRCFWNNRPKEFV